MYGAKRKSSARKCFARELTNRSHSIVSLAAQKSATTVELKNGQGQSVGTATLSPAKDGGVSVALGGRTILDGVDLNRALTYA